MTQVFRQEQLDGVTCVLREKLCILEARKCLGLNKRSELVSKCRAENRFYLSNYIKTSAGAIIIV